MPQSFVSSHIWRVYEFEAWMVSVLPTASLSELRLSEDYWQYRRHSCWRVLEFGEPFLWFCVLLLAQRFLSDLGMCWCLPSCKRSRIMYNWWLLLGVGGVAVIPRRWDYHLSRLGVRHGYFYDWLPWEASSAKFSFVGYSLFYRCRARIMNGLEVLTCAEKLVTTGFTAETCTDTCEEGRSEATPPILFITIRHFGGAILLRRCLHKRRKARSRVSSQAAGALVSHVF